MAKLAEKTETHILGCIRRGVSFDAACRSSGVTASAVRRAMRADPALRERVDKARADAEVLLVAQMHELAKKSSRAAAWLLERVNPDRYGGGSSLTDEEVRKIW